MSRTAMKYVKGKGLIAYTIESLKSEPPPQKAARPLVWFSDWGENMQWAMWASVHGILPLVSEEDEQATIRLARHYRIDSLVTDVALSLKVARVAAEAVGEKNIRHIMIIDSETPDYSSLRALLPHARVTFYRALPEKGIVDVTHGPYETTANELVRNIMPSIPGIDKYSPGEPQSSKLTLVYTAGTTGELKMFVRTIPHIAPEHAQFFAYDRTLQVHVRKNLAFRIFHETLMGQHPSNLWLSVGPKVQKSAEFIDIVRDFKPTDFVGVTLASYSHFLKTVEQCDAEALKSVERCYVGASLLERPLYNSLARVMPKASIILAYASTETSFVGRSCIHLAKSEVPKYVGIASPVHPLRPVEIIEPDERGIGEIVVEGTRTGDSGRIIEQKCPCGAGQTLYVYGRVANDRINCAGAIFYAAEVARVMEKLRDFIADYRLEVGEKELNGEVLGCTRLTILPTATLKIRADKALFVHEACAKGLRLTRTRTLADLERDRVFLPMKLHFVEGFSDIKPCRLQKSL